MFCIKVIFVGLMLFSNTVRSYTRLNPYVRNFSGLAASAKKVQIKTLAPEYKPKTENQRKYVDALQNKDIGLLVALGPAGCGKTLFACAEAIQNLKRGEIQKIILTRPMVSVENEEIGFLPGNLVSKMDPWTRPMFDIFSEYYSQNDIHNMIQAGTIEVCPLAYMRGRTFHRSFILADEMQNSSPMQTLMLTTRIGQHSKMVLMGDLQQSDTNRNNNNGLFDFLQKYNLQKSNQTAGIHVVELQGEDVLRSPIVTQVLKIYETNVHTLSPNSIPKQPKLNNKPNTNITISNKVTQSDITLDAALIPKSLISKHFTS